MKEEGETVPRKQLRRGQVVKFFATLPLLVVGGFAKAQPALAPVVGVLSYGFQRNEQRLTDALREGLSAPGLVEGVGYRLVLRYAEGDDKRLPQLARELAQAGCRVIVTTGTTAVRAVHTELPDMPIVMAGSADPVAMGFAKSLARPGGKITGLSILGSELIGKRVEVLKELVPGAMRFAVFMQKANPGNPVFRAAFADIGQRLDLDIQVREISGLGELTDALTWAKALPAHGLYVVEDPSWGDGRALFAAALNHGLPTVSGPRGYADAGALAAYAVDSTAYRRGSGRYVAAILAGADPAELAIEQPSHLSLTINVRTAKALGLVLSPLVLARADEVIE